MDEIFFHILAASLLLNFFLLIYIVPKVRRESDYWRQRATWYERYCDDLLAGYEPLPGERAQAGLSTDAGAGS